LGTKSDINNKIMNVQELDIIAKGIGLNCRPIEINYRQLTEEIHFPAIISWKTGSYAILHNVIKVSKWTFLPWANKEEKLIVSVPRDGMRSMDKKTFLENWLQNNQKKGTVLIFMP
jgi:ABC-type bacteriocin/lantibiotic exporter with double-glycine peptidase domain